MNRSPTWTANAIALCGEMDACCDSSASPPCMRPMTDVTELLADQIVYLSAGRVAAVRAVTPTSGEVA